jgi:hypothetical protein
MQSGIRGSLGIFLAGLIIFAGGCVTKNTLRPDSVEPDEKRDMYVFTRDFRTIEFTGGKYNIVDSAGVFYIRGYGIEYQPDSADAEVTFAGFIPFSNIDRIETREMDVYSTLYVTLFIGFFAAVGFSTNLTD